MGGNKPYVGLSKNRKRGVGSDLELGGMWNLWVNYTTFGNFSGGHNQWFLYQGWGLKCKSYQNSKRGFA